ncbi:MAG: TrmH family RNA methyltransferase [bacterium]|nr:TrmH family RNA methyltransferase [bacterium]
MSSPSTQIPPSQPPASNNSPFNPANVRVVLCHTAGQANIGAVARSMACFGLEKLFLAAPLAAPGSEARNWACAHGLPVLNSCTIVPTLAEALQGTNLAAGFTRREGHDRHQMMSLPEFHQHLLNSPNLGGLALVFGNEESGLSNAETEACHKLVNIPSFGSLNLAHAVSLGLYELFARERAPELVHSEQHELASPELRRSLVKAIGEHLAAMGYPSHRSTLTAELVKMANLLERARLEKWEVNYLGGMFKQLRNHYESALAAPPPD